MAKLSKEEKKIADDFAAGKYKKTTSSRDYKSIAQASKESRINLRLQNEVLDFFKAQSERDGIPYQTLINSYLYKIATGRLIEKNGIDDRIEALEKEVFKKVK